MNILDCIIIGAGPAGMTAAIQAKRQGFDIAILEKHKAGGQLLAANRVENFPGLAKGISGKDFVKRFTKQLYSHGIRIIKSEVTELSKEGDTFRLKTNKENFSARFVIVACGLVPRKLSIPGEKEFLGKKIFSYIIPEAVPHSGKKVLVIGSGDAAFDQAISFAKKAASVKVAMNKNFARCSTSLYWDAIKKRVEIFSNYSAVSFCESRGRVKTSFQNGRTIIADIVITCIGKERDFSFIAPELLKENVTGIHFAGDCKHGRNTHAVIACGDGSSAAMKLL